MKLGFYYHIPAKISIDNRVGLPAFLGLFVDSLANEVDQLYCFFHISTAASQQEEAGVEYWCKAHNIVVASLGSDKRAYVKAFFPGKFIHKVEADIKECDAILVRGPSPLAPYFRHYDQETKIVNFIVGSYQDGEKYLQLPWYKQWAVRMLVKYMHHKTMDSVKGARLLVNSRKLEEALAPLALATRQIYTTTLSREDYFRREDVCQGAAIKLLFVGRLDWAKGLRELFEAFVRLRQESDVYELHLVGWEEQATEPVRQELSLLTAKKGLQDVVFFHGRKKAGGELLAFYRQSDIYVLPSYHEGFPRTIWEAMASSMPVICTPVGSIPFYLEHEKEVLMIKTGDVEAIVEAIKILVKNSTLRKKLISNGFGRVQEIRLDVQAKKIVEFIHE